MSKGLVLIATTILLQSCAVLISGSKQKVTFKTNVEKAQVYANFDYVGESNEEINLYRRNIPKMYTISAEGCKDTSFVLNEQFNKWCYLDVIIPYFYTFDLALEVHRKTDDTVKIDLDCTPSEK
ncbi:MAG: hypothetical protein ABJG68_15805 [Crocinitomicaceae bacterium]